jgi:hypothetical protein
MVPEAIEFGERVASLCVEVRGIDLAKALGRMQGEDGSIDQKLRRCGGGGPVPETSASAVR